jgi:anhydro-N-acetylmuramic acid kinase
MSFIPTLSRLLLRPELNIVGAMSGTSMDSISLACCKFVQEGEDAGDASMELLWRFEAPYTAPLRKRLSQIAHATPRDIAELELLVGQDFARVINLGIKKSKMRDLDLIGSHGQTIYHHSRIPGALKATLQVGDGDVIAACTGIPVVSDFRMKDIAWGGEGAPITPYADAVFFGSSEEQKIRVVLNLGGIGNITVLHDDIEQVRGFDTGPANGPLDRLARILSKGKKSFDKDGAYALKGQVSERFLKRLFAQDSFIAQKPPKSTGFEAYGDAFVQQAMQQFGSADVNLMATLVAFSAESIARALKSFVTPKLKTLEVIAAGGGTKNPALMREIEARIAPATLMRSSEFGIPEEGRESMAFALFARDALFGNPSSFPSITGVSEPTVMGKLSVP